MSESTTPTDSPNKWVADHTRTYVESGGEEGHLWYGPDGSLAEGVPTLLLTTIGRRSGQPRRTALIYSQDGDDYLVVASKGGAQAHPLWYRNLVDNPEVELQVKADAFKATARTATPQEKARLWPKMVEVWPPYTDYQKRTDRDIPVVVLTSVS
ncbi:nitroreductase family deazaflavin-dependent oxidoreductase [Pseudofrankia sp. BMG5.36]|uniref:nitroreductase family deazaflavin-dependent oxidoreductase n=1 Tax=Pseudofrankia sp. BMG5.36 TaxID=1834512 RepID=UPI0008DA6DEB|nr:nitroreductase family deazaflavin-dependent oxidoreductase [Pseudofrankia sp. BMG5.36]OHV56929.1 nitroreductase [Pseudofrankia sp. BMG5.36]